MTAFKPLPLSINTLHDMEAIKGVAELTALVGARNLTIASATWADHVTWKEQNWAWYIWWHQYLRLSFFLILTLFNAANAGNGRHIELGGCHANKDRCQSKQYQKTGSHHVGFEDWDWDVVVRTTEVLWCWRTVQSYLLYILTYYLFGTFMYRFEVFFEKLTPINWKRVYYFNVYMYFLLCIFFNLWPYTV